MDLAYGLALPIAELKVAGDAWTVAGYVSTYGNVDAGGDVVIAGAFDDSLKSGRKPKFLFAHKSDSILGVPLEWKSDAHGLFGRFKISRTRLGEEVHTLLKDGAVDAFSIGYIPTEVEFDNDVRLLKSVDLLEASIVPVPMNERALVTDVKSAELLEAAREYLAEGADEEKAVWSTAYVNDLPDSAFAVILPGGSKDSDGKTTPRSLRKLPHHDTDGKIDLPHLRNAMSREPQADMPDAAHQKAHAHLMSHARSEGVGDMGKDGLTFEHHASAVLDGVEAFIDRSRDLAALRAGDGRRPGEAFFLRLKNLRAGLDSLLTLEHAPKGAVSGTALRLELARRRLSSRARMQETR